MPDKLSVYNGALFILKNRPLATLSDARTERRSLDAAWNGTLDYMLEAALWNFAAKTDEMNPSETVESQFGYQYVYEKPDDYVRIIKIGPNDRLNPTLEDFSEETDYILCDVNPLYMQYVSDAFDYGADPGKWAASFTRAFELELAYRTAPLLTTMSEAGLERIRRDKEKALYYAKGKDAVNQPMAELPNGRLVQARLGFYYGRRDGTPFWRR